MLLYKLKKLFAMFYKTLHSTFCLNLIFRNSPLTQRSSFFFSFTIIRSLDSLLGPTPFFLGNNILRQFLRLTLNQGNVQPAGLNYFTLGSKNNKIKNLLRPHQA